MDSALLGMSEIIPLPVFPKRIGVTLKKQDENPLH